MPDEIKALVEEFLKRVVPLYRPRKVILFGSYARGHAHSHSDVDLLVVMDSGVSSRRMANEMDLLMVDRTVAMDLIVLTSEQYERQRQFPGTVASEAEREGQVVYEFAA